jgi:hypothetical protein
VQLVLVVVVMHVEVLLLRKFATEMLPARSLSKASLQPRCCQRAH